MYINCIFLIKMFENKKEEKLRYFEKKEGVWFSHFHKFELYTAITFII